MVRIASSLLTPRGSGLTQIVGGRLAGLLDAYCEFSRFLSNFYFWIAVRIPKCRNRVSPVSVRIESLAYLSRMLVATTTLLPVLADEREVADAGAKFAVDVEVINVYATVRDRDGRLLETLERDDFVLWEDGFVQEIGYFAYETNVPLRIGLLVDTSNSQAALIPDQRRAGVQFFRAVLQPDKDMAFLLTFDQEVELLQDYTNSLALLEQGLDDLHVKPFIPGASPPPAGGRMRGGTAMYDGLYLAAEEMFRQQTGRKVAVIVSDGYDTGSMMRLARAIEAAQRADVVAYSIQYLDWRFETYAYRDRKGLGADALRTISEQTGGSFFRVSESLRLDGVFQQIEEEMRGVYSIGYTPRSGLDKPGYRKIKLTSPRMDVRSIQARDGYYVGVK